jgi:hypothetical protein
MAKFTKARGFGRDEAGEEFRAMLDDDDVSFGDIIAGAIASAPAAMAEEVYQSLKEMGEDTRGPKSWARDRMERRRLGKDADGRLRRYGRDVENMQPRGSNGGENNLEPRGSTGGEDRRMAGDMAYDRRPALFDRLIPGAARVDRG